MVFKIVGKGLMTTNDTLYKLVIEGAEDLNFTVDIIKASKSKKDGKTIYHVNVNPEDVRHTFHVTTLRDEHKSFHILSDAREQVEKILNSEYQKTFLKKLIKSVFGEKQR